MRSVCKMISVAVAASLNGPLLAVERIRVVLGVIASSSTSISRSEARASKRCTRRWAINRRCSSNVCFVPRRFGVRGIEAGSLAHEVGVTEAARRLDIPVSSIQNWMKPSYAGKLQKSVGKKGVTEVQAEIARLRREVASLKVDNEILRKAAAYFAKGSR
jgi:transposase